MSSNLEWEEKDSLTSQATSTALLTEPRLRLGGTRGKLGYFLAAILQHPKFGLGYIIVVGVVLVGLLAPWLAPYSPVTADPLMGRSSESSAAWIGSSASTRSVASMPPSERAAKFALDPFLGSSGARVSLQSDGRIVVLSSDGAGGLYVTRFWE